MPTATRDDVFLRLENMVPKRESTWPKFLWRASGIGYCYRKQVLEARGLSMPISDTLKRKFAGHNAVHEQVQQWIVDNLAPVIVEREYPTEKQIELPEVKALRVGGHVDAILDYIPLVIEIKTLNPFYTKKILSGDAKSYWRHQLNLYIYMARLDETIEGDIMGCSLLADIDGNINTIAHEYDEEFLERLSVLNGCWDANVLPPPCWECEEGNNGSCPLHHICTEPLSTIEDFWQMASQELTVDEQVVPEETLLDEATS